MENGRGEGGQEMNKRQACLSDPRLLTMTVALSRIQNGNTYTAYLSKSPHKHYIISNNRTAKRRRKGNISSASLSVIVCTPVHI